MTDPQTKEIRRYCGYCVVAALSSLLSLVAFVLYGRFHTIAFRAHHFDTDPGFVNYPLVDTMKTTSVILAVIGLILIVAHRHRASRWFRWLAIVLTLLACMTIPFVT